MHPLARAALLGTARHGEVPPTIEAIDGLLVHRPELSPERRLLLTAGAWSVFAAAARRPAPAPPLPGKASADPRPPCSAGAAVLIESMVHGTQRELLPLAIDRLERAGQRLPGRLLPKVFELGGTEHADAVRGILGPRARWLAAQNPEWAWVTATTGDALPADADERWQTDPWRSRLSLLAMAHRVEPERARRWITAAMKEEGASERERLLLSIADTVTADDEPMLLGLTKDRAQSVRAAVFALLDRLPQSAVASRIRSRARTVLRWRQPATVPARNLLSRVIGGTDETPAALSWEGPPSLPGEWAQDGIREDKPPVGMGPRTWWLVQLVSRVDPNAWCQAFDATARQLVAGIDEDSWELAHALSLAAATHRNSEWASPLFDWWRAHPEQTRSAQQTRYRLELVRLMPPDVASDLAVQLLASSDANDAAALIALLSALPRPWKPPVAQAWLGVLRQTAAVLNTKSDLVRTTPSGLGFAGLALPDASIAEGLRPLATPDEPDWPARQFITRFDRFQNQLRTRQRLIDEIPL